MGDKTINVDCYLQKFDKSNITKKFEFHSGGVLCDNPNFGFGYLDSICLVKFNQLDDWIGFAWVFTRKQIMGFLDGDKVNLPGVGKRVLKDDYYALVYKDLS